MNRRHSFSHSRQGPRWLIANIIYDNGKSLIDHYRGMTGR
jgi:hypothetical protein